MLTFHKAWIDLVRWSQLRARGFGEGNGSWAPEAQPGKLMIFQKMEGILGEDMSAFSLERKSTLFVLGKHDDFICVSTRLIISRLLHLHHCNDFMIL